jgi:hypothetical protein
MDGASLLALVTPQIPAAAGLLPGAAPAVDAARAGFAALLGATELAGLTADQQAALSQLLTDPVGALVTAADAGGKMSPPAAIVDLLNALGVDLKRVLAGGGEAGAPAAGDRQEPTDAVDGPAAALLSLLAPVLPGGGPASPPAPAEEAAVVPLFVAGQAHPALPEPDAVGQAIRKDGDAAAAQAPAAAVWQVLRDLSRGQIATPTVAAEALPADGDTTFPEVAGLAAALAIPANVRKASGAESSGDLLAGVGALLDAEGTLPGRAALAAAPDLVPARTTSPAAAGVAVPVGERGWERAFAERVVWLVSQQVQAAEVKLNPPHLGPVEVRLALNGQEASVSFTVAHGAVRDAVEQAIPRLREMFAEQNLQIVNVDVGQRDASSQASTGERNGSAPASPGRAAVANAQIPDPAVPRRRESGLPGLVDEYA